MADALSHHANLLFASSSYESNLENQILSTENYDREYRILKEKTTKNQTKTVVAQKQVVHTKRNKN